MRKKICILSIDGGGIRGIIPAKILVRLEELLQEYSQNPQARLSDYFDLIAGTSTGSILTALYLCPSDEGQSSAKYTAKEALDLYLQEGPKLFERSWTTKMIDYFGLTHPLYKANHLESLLTTHLGDLKLSDLLKPCLIPSYDIESGKAVFFNQMTARKNASRNFLVKDAVRASTAAPTFFPVKHVLNSVTHLSHTFIDGGLVANNPTLCAYVEACKLKDYSKTNDIMILSLGTGAVDKTYTYDQAKKWGKIGWIVPLIHIYGSVGSQTVDHQLQMLYRQHHVPTQYLRIEPNLTDFEVNHDMDDASVKNILALEYVGEQMIEAYDEQLKSFARQLQLNQSMR